MSKIRSHCLMIALGLGLAGATAIATPASVTTCSDSGRVDGSSREISEVQAILQHAGYLDPGDYRKGEDDASTRLAVRIFQSNHGLAPTGTVDYETMTQLLSHAGTIDGDGDGVADDRDRCPGTRTGSWVDAQGCPEATQRASLFGDRKSLALEGVRFDTGTAHLTLGSRVALDRVAKSLMSWPDARVEVAGYTDSRNSDSYNLKLSRERSAAVCEYLVVQGVASSRLKEKGFGESHPIADNATAAGRATNRRVELTRID
jgi:outer membrane protein OmpA-like peptidoglycan-associated protein